MAKQLTKHKALEILHDKTVHGNPITEKQRRYFGYIASQKVNGGDLPMLYFTGGSFPPMQGSYGRSSSPDPNSQMANSAMQAGIGLATGNPMSMLSAAPGYIGGIVSNVKDVSSNPDANLFEKGLSAVSPIAGMIFGDKARQRKRDIERDTQSRQEYAIGTSGMSPQSHIYADGGAKPKLTEFNEGGSHEENPIGGVPQGINKANGQPNLVEQGETKFKDYIFSDRLKLNDAKEYNLGGRLSGKTFADISKKLSKIADERPNDPIAKRGQEMSLNRLKMANDDAIEMKNFEEENSQYKTGGQLKGVNKYNYGGFTFTDF